MPHDMNAQQLNLFEPVDFRPLLSEFYADVLAMLEDPNSQAFPAFSPSSGLCFNLAKWTRQSKYLPCPEDYTGRLIRAMRLQFVEAGLDECYPFDARHTAYRMASSDGSLYQNEARLNWIKQHAERQP